jgi:hypothetical protein
VTRVERESLEKFWECMKNLFALKMRSTLIQKFNYKSGSGELEFPDKFNAKPFL